MSVRVRLSAFVQDPSRGKYLVAHREVVLPVPPFVGLNLYFTEIIEFRVAEVTYNTNTGEWFANEEDTEIKPVEEQVALTGHGLPPERIEDDEESFKEAGFSVDYVEAPEPARRPRHLRPVRDNDPDE